MAITRDTKGLTASQRASIIALRAALDTGYLAVWDFMDALRAIGTAP